MSKMLKMRKRGKQQPTKSPSPCKLHLVAEIVEFPNDPAGQCDRNETMRYLKLADNMLADEKYEIEAAS
jgi:hypothetical protein